ncbi:Maf family protein [Buchananella hordeovulneris]|uniref:Nucleoside triphosphate pyrophosphatase n=1 Tax=Buchananella hordeovulneris TaxID=52770 RepID=A0A1Q5PWN8_9ACTO|nr:Maf family protein [Buchananella hordeovulneris]OKL51882.1 septum formation inhibitor Maf [Buchananella hordeovulneris]
MQVVLASASPARLTTLRAAGLAPQVLVSHADEEGLLTQLSAAAPADQVQALARAKATEVAGRLDATRQLLVIGCDSMLELDGQVVGKPGSAAVARERWQAMAGRSGVLHTGHCVLRAVDGRWQEACATSSTVVHFASPTPAELAAYLASGEPLAVAGAFTLDGLGGAFVRGIEGDPHGVVGISLPLVRELCAQLAVTWTDLWRAELLSGNGTH